MKKPPPGRAVRGGSGKAAPAKKKAAPAKKPAAKKPPTGLTGPALAAHKAHQAHLAHLAHLAQAGQPRLAHNARLAQLQRLAQLAQMAQRPPAAPAHQRRQLALGDGVACCAAEALAASLRLTGRRVDDADVLALYRRTAASPDTGASIVATLEAASEFGLAGTRPVSFMPTAIGEIKFRYSAILGVDLPGPHAVLDDGSGWWSWGELHDPAGWPDAVIEEAWAVTWG